MFYFIYLYAYITSNQENAIIFRQWKLQNLLCACSYLNKAEISIFKQITCKTCSLTSFIDFGYFFFNLKRDIVMTIKKKDTLAASTNKNYA